MYKKEIFRNLDKDHDNHLYTGLQGYIMKNGHRDLEKFKSNKKEFKKILEVGGGSTPHIEFLNHSFEEYIIIETSDYAINLNKDSKKFKVIKYDGKNIPFPDNIFDRIIISHCLEHINFPEEFIFEMMRVLKKGGILSISLPTDPGITWRLGRLYVKLFKLKHSYKINSSEFEYLNSIEHVNSVFNLRSILRYNFKDSLEESFYPFKIKSLDLNLIYNVHIYK